MRHCLNCHTELLDGEDTLCLECQGKLSLMDCHTEPNPFWDKFYGKIHFEHAAALGHYEPETLFFRLVHNSKYGSKPWINAYLTRLLLTHLEGSDWPYDIDLLIPIPLHWYRHMRRGYNQVSPIVETLSEQWHLPIENRCIKREGNTASMVWNGLFGRRDRDESNFKIVHPERLTGRHILLVDDVCTTGSTIEKCSDLLLQIPGVRISVLCLGASIHI